MPSLCQAIKPLIKSSSVGYRRKNVSFAGTGAFLEEMSLRLSVPLEEMNGLAVQAEGMVQLGSFCTVFSGTEVLENTRKGILPFE